MTATQYIGARYVPVFADPAEWDKAKAYEPLTIVIHEGNSYTSAQYVPVGIDISNTEFWKLTGNYNAQVEKYRQEVAGFDGRITANADAVVTEANRAKAAEKVNADAVVSENTKMINNDYSGHYAVWVGDSYVEANSLGTPETRFARIVSDYFGLTEINYAKGGTGYTISNPDNDGKNFSGQLDNAIADTTYDHAKVKYVFIAGGRNDAENNSNSPFTNISAVVTSINTIIRNATIAYPNAEIVFIPMLYDCVPMSGKQTSLYNYLCWIYAKNSFLPAKINVIKNAYLWLNGRFTAVFDKDKIHPNQVGHYVIAEQIISNLLGFGSIPANTVQAYADVLDRVSGKGSLSYINIDESGNLWLHCDIYTTNQIPFGQKLLDYTPTVNYESADTLFTIRGQYITNAFLSDASTDTRSQIAVQLTADCNFATTTPSYQFNVQYLGMPLTDDGEKHIVVNSIIGKVGQTLIKQ